MLLVGIYPNRAMILYIIAKFEDVPETILCYLFLNSGNTFNYCYVTQFLFVVHNCLEFSLFKLTLLILCNFICCSQG